MTRDELITVVTQTLTASGELSAYIASATDNEVIDASLAEVVEAMVDAVLAAQGGE